MKRIIFIVAILFSATALSAQELDLRHEVRLSAGTLMLPNDKGGFTANYMYRVANWFWVGANVNWQFPSATPTFYRWREYNFNGTVSDFEISTRDRFFAVAPELRFSCHNGKKTTIYGAISAGYGIFSATNREFPLKNIYDEYWFWHITLFGINLNLGKKENIIFGGEFGVGFKGLYSIHVGYRF